MHSITAFSRRLFAETSAATDSGGRSQTTPVSLTVLVAAISSTSSDSPSFLAIQSIASWYLARGMTKRYTCRLEM